MFKILVMCIFLTLQIKTKKCEVESFSAVTAMMKLLDTQAHLIKYIGSTLQTVDKKDRSIVKTYLAKLKKEHALSRSDPEHYLGNPINSYALIMRLFRDLQTVEQIIYKMKSLTAYRRNTSLVYPATTDVNGANIGLILLHVLYDLDIKQIADGVLRTRFSKNREQFEEFVSPLTANDCYDLAKLYFIEEDRVPYITWLEQAYKQHKTDHDLSLFTEAELLKEIAQNYEYMDDWKNTIYWTEKYLAVNKNDYDMKKFLENIKDNYDEEDEYIPKPRVSLAKKMGIDLPDSKLCYYERRMAGNVSLSCYYAHGPHPFLLLAPFRAEFLHRGPDITMFYDVISDVEIEALKAHVTPRLSKSEVLGADNYKKNFIRISHTATASDEFPATVRVLRRIQQFTGLWWSQTSRDKMFISNYGLAGYFSPHCDFVDLREFNHNYKQRIASVLLYLSNVKQGGATIFFHANITVFPVKNAGLFWYNLDAWGIPDIKTVHASCPVVRGSKWVANKWITVIDQDLSRPCPMHPPEPENFTNICS